VSRPFDPDDAEHRSWRAAVEEQVRRWRATQDVESIDLDVLDVRDNAHVDVPAQP
jgi:hypothetical protein